MNQCVYFVERKAIILNYAKSRLNFLSPGQNHSYPVNLSYQSNSRTSDSYQKPKTFAQGSNQNLRFDQNRFAPRYNQYKPKQKRQAAFSKGWPQIYNSIDMLGYGRIIMNNVAY